MDLGKRVEMKSAAATSREQQQGEEDDGEREFEEMLLREHSVSTDMGSLDWKRMKIPPVLTSSQSARLFKTMQPMKVHQFIHSFSILYVVTNETITVIMQFLCFHSFRRSSKCRRACERSCRGTPPRRSSPRPPA